VDFQHVNLPKPEQTTKEFSTKNVATKISTENILRFLIFGGIWFLIRP